MTLLEYILFFWISMALIKWAIVLGTHINTIINHKDIVDGMPALIINSIVGSLVSSVIIFVIWPASLYKDKLNFFAFPDKRMEKIFVKLIDQRNRI